MISYIKGSITEICKDRVVIENNNMGYNVFVPGSVVSCLNTRDDVKLYTYLNVREDAMLLYGFLTKDDLEVFKLLINVSGIGPKVALGILSTIPSDDLRFAVLAGDVKAICKAPGVGNKTAQKLIIELKDKLKIEDVLSSKGDEHLSDAGNTNKSDAIQALTALGYSATASMKAVNQISVDEDMDVEQILKEALKKISVL